MISHSDVVWSSISFWYISYSKACKLLQLTALVFFLFSNLCGTICWTTTKKTRLWWKVSWKLWFRFIFIESSQSFVVRWEAGYLWVNPKNLKSAQNVTSHHVFASQSRKQVVGTKTNHQLEGEGFFKLNNVGPNSLNNFTRKFIATRRRTFWSHCEN